MLISQEDHTPHERREPQCCVLVGLILSNHNGMGNWQESHHGDFMENVQILRDSKQQWNFLHNSTLNWESPSEFSCKCGQEPENTRRHRMDILMTQAQIAIQVNSKTRIMTPIHIARFEVVASTTKPTVFSTHLKQYSGGVSYAYFGSFVYHMYMFAKEMWIIQHVHVLGSFCVNKENFRSFFVMCSGTHTILSVVHQKHNRKGTLNPPYHSHSSTEKIITKRCRLSFSHFIFYVLSHRSNANIDWRGTKTHPHQYWICMLHRDTQVPPLQARANQPRNTPPKSCMGCHRQMWTLSPTVQDMLHLWTVHPK